MIFKQKGNNPLFTLQCLGKGLLWLGKAPLRKFLWMPILINLLVYSVALGVGYFYINTVIAHFIPSWLQWLSWLLYPLFFGCVAVIGFFSFSLLANLIAAPFYGKLARKTLQLFKPNENSDIPEPSWGHTMLEELRRIAYLIKWMLLLLIISMIPGLNLLAPVLWGMFAAWGCALEYFAYPLENKGLLFTEQRKLAGSVRLGALSFGSVVLLGLGLPIVNLLVAPLAVIAATFYIAEISAETTA